MKLKEGRIGKQETASLVGIALAMSGVFTMDSAAYDNGNSTYLWLPLAIAVAFGVYWLLSVGMQRCGQRELSAMANYCFGKLLGGAIIYLLSAILLLNAFLVLSRFLSMVHSFIFVDSDYTAIALWIILPVGLLAFFGLEGVGRTAKCLAWFLGILLLISYIWPLSGVKLYRLYPLLGDGAVSVVKNTFSSTYKLFPALAATLATTGTQGVKNARMSSLVGVICALVVCFASQFILALMYTHAELAEMYFPLFRINMPLMEEGYYLRLDKIALFLWLAGALVCAAYYVYSAALLFARRSGGGDVRPPVFSMCIVLASVMLIEHVRSYGLIQQLVEWLNSYAFIIVLLPALAAALIGWLKSRKKEKKRNEAG